MGIAASPGHLRTLTQLAEIGAIVAPLMPGFYSRPEAVSDIVDHQVGRLLDLLNIEPPEGLINRWQGPRDANEDASLSLDDEDAVVDEPHGRSVRH